MIKETITYEDYNGMNRTEDFYFNFTKAELMEMEMGTTGGYAEMIKRIIASSEAPSIIKVFKELVLNSYGQKSLDGRRFIKTPELTAEFSQTEAYSQLFMKLATDADAAAKFVNGVMPADLVAQAQAQVKLQNQVKAAKTKKTTQTVTE